MTIKNVLLTDFEWDRFKGKYLTYNLPKMVEDLNKIASEGKLLGEKKHPEYDEIKPENSIIQIENLIYEDKKIFGDVTFLSDEARGIYETGGYRHFSFRGLQWKEGSKLKLKIITWDLERG